MSLNFLEIIVIDEGSLKLNECELFNGMTGDEIEDLLKGNGYRTKKFIKDTVISILQTNRSYLINYLSTIGNKVNILAEKIRLFQFSSIQQKIAGYLLNLYEKQGSNSLVIPYTRENLADFFGVAHPSLSRELSRMSEAGIIAIDGKKIQLLKETALKYLLDGEILN